MSRLAKVEILGPIALAIMIVGAEAAAMMLAARPSSIIAWYLNLEVFSVFQRSYTVIGGRLDMPFAQLALVAVPIMLFLLAGLIRRRQLFVAVANHLSFAYACFVAYAWYVTNLITAPAASLDWLQTQGVSALRFQSLIAAFNPHGLLLITMLAATFISFAASQLRYLRAVRGAR
jgi:hypothetical protein